MEDYYEDETQADEYEEDEAFGSAQDDLPWWVRKSPAVLVSIGVHALILIVTAYMEVMAGRQKREKEPKTIATQEYKRQKYNEEAERDIKSCPAIPAEKIVENPIKITEEEIPIVTDIPRGTSFDNHSNKNRKSTSIVDAYGLGGGACGAYGARWGLGSPPGGGGILTESAVLAALRWLHFHQDRDGRWDIDGFTKNCTRGNCGGEAEAANFDVGTSGLALLAFLGNGHTHRVGAFKKTVRKGLRFLKREQDSSGRFGPCEGESWFYNHAIALMAVSEAYAITKDTKMKKMAENGLKYGLNAQNPGYGWKYEPRGGKNDTSVTGWMVLALKAAKTGDLNVPKQAFLDARKWFDRVTHSNGRCGYEKPGDPGSKLRGQTKHFDRQETMTAVALICRIFTGQKRKDSTIKKGADLLMKKLPTFDEPNHNKVNYYYWYNGTYAMFQVGGKDWETWNKAMKKALVKTQCRGGCPDGSWDPVGEWCIVGGRVYATAINALTLEIYYRYKRMHDPKARRAPKEVAKR